MTLIKKLTITAFIIAAASCLAYELAPFALEYRALQRVAGAAFKDHKNDARVVSVLSAVLAQKSSGVLAEFAALSGLPRENVASLSLGPAEPRCYAARMLGRSRAAGALQALAAFESAGGASDVPGGLLDCAELGRLEYLDPQTGVADRITFARSVLLDDHFGGGGSIRGAAYDWAMDRICDLGASTDDLELIRRSDNKIRSSGLDAGVRVQSCTAKAEVLARSPDRVSALKSAVIPVGHTEKNEIVPWALGQLLSEHSAEADRVVLEYLSAAGKLTSDDPSRYNGFWQAKDAAEFWTAWGRHQ